MDEEEFMNLLKASLPPYIVQCFIMSGYDSARVVAQMTTNGPDNSINQMEKFILKEYSDDPSCYHMSKTKSTYVFAPGHRIKIADFINDVKAYKVPIKRKLNNNLATKKNFDHMHHHQLKIHQSHLKNPRDLICKVYLIV